MRAWSTPTVSAWELEHVPGVKAVTSFADQTRRVVAATSEGYYKWGTIARDSKTLGYAAGRVIQDNPDSMNPNCSVFPVIAYLADHRADTLARTLKTVEDFAATHNRPDAMFLPAAGSAGIEAVTNIVVQESFYIMHAVLYVAVILLCFITFRSWRAVVVAIVPLAITSILCEAIMVLMGIGVKVATLPVIALGVGVGVDYALYLLSIQLAIQRRGGSLREAYSQSLQFTGKVVALVGATMAAGVVTWAWSPIKFQADMGILLTFMFIWNMLGALVLIPALSHFLLAWPGPPRRCSLWRQARRRARMDLSARAAPLHRVGRALAATTVSISLEPAERHVVAAAVVDLLEMRERCPRGVGATLPGWYQPSVSPAKMREYLPPSTEYMFCDVCTVAGQVAGHRRDERRLHAVDVVRHLRRRPRGNPRRAARRPAFRPGGRRPRWGTGS